jgi:hypothetical protein
MKVGDMVTWSSRFGMGLPADVGIILGYIPYELRMGDRFPHWRVLFAGRGVLHCRESDLKVFR